ncbi:polysaccharide deacetylase family protein [Roseofilum sp. BLCC_M154]|uniref:Polysaccharide deacetylase family protein n=1 Tax=Roseofilum acuticapitatum BLCC-M154 TaxID=3022444 RepID=A0ABT7AXB6_9CYAN|nr:polysaccharide deacetylase family protein [Roseofilum acuticapitatum]MDJ1170916.1 polysaccharide deacetylase family protein [Roseofilum acuticapitatum BLCC-M154]
MTYSEISAQPSLLQLAKEGNPQAITYWMNSLLAPQGVSVQVNQSADQWLNVQVDFHHPKRKDQCLNLQQRLVRFVCYRLWTLNSSTIHHVRIVARQAGDQRILWKQAVRILTPASEQIIALPPAAGNPNSTPLPFQFGLMRTLFLSRLTAASFILSCWWFYAQLINAHWINQNRFATSTPLPPDPAPTLSASPEASPVPMAPPKLEPSFKMIEVPEPFRGKVIRKAEALAMPKVIALTFDDGPWPKTTEQVLDILKENQIKATFFFVGQHLQQYPKIAKKVADAGHALGNHTQHHYTQTVDAQTAAQEIESTSELIFDITGIKTKLFRPPGGNLDTGLADYAASKGYGIMMWSADSEDYYVSTPVLIDKVLKAVSPGGIVLLHDGGGDRRNTVEALPQIITTLKQQGYRFVTVPELLEIEAQQTPLNEMEEE